ncbi:MAG TPA: DUF4157 domain-containing protein [Kofleriaceae bacterium]|jgi:hypothetical protein
MSFEPKKAQAPEPEPIHAAAQAGVAGPAGPLPYADRIQAAFGRHDLSGIRAHSGPSASEQAYGIGAQACTAGSQPALAPAGDELVAHEAAHVVQQREGVIKP